MDKIIYIGNKPFYLYDSYDSYNEAYKVARYYRRKNGSRSMIFKYQHGFLFPDYRYVLYLNKVRKIW